MKAPLPQFPALRILQVAALIAASAPLAVAAGPAPQPPVNAAAAKALVAQNYGKIPLSFEANQGQADKTVKFVSRGSGYSLFLTDSSAVLALTKPDTSNGKLGHTAGKSLKPASAHPASKTDVVGMDLAGANRATHVSGMAQLPGTANYFIGNDPAQWHSGVPTFARVRYAGVYPGIDLVYYGNQRQLEYDFVVAPGASPKPIRLQFVGARKLDLTTDGDLTVSAANGQIAFHKPVIYQVKDGVRQPVDGQFAMLSANTVGFRLGRYDHAKPLVIDPVLSYSTYLGGSISDVAYGIAVDSSGNAYVVGDTLSTNFPVTSGAFQTMNNTPAAGAEFNEFITKLNPTGTALVYSTYLGGSAGDLSNTGIAVDSSGDAYVTGTAVSTDFPVTAGAYQTVDKAALVATAFVTKLNATGTALVYSTFLGGSISDSANAIALDGSGDAYVTGVTASMDFPTTAGAFQAVNNNPSTCCSYITGGNAFIAKLNPAGTALEYSTYLGGSGRAGTAVDGDSGLGIAVDRSGNAYVTGQTESTDFPVTTGAFQTANNQPNLYGVNAFVTKLNATGRALVYSTYLGGSGISESGVGDVGNGIAVDGSGDAYVTGSATSQNFPVTAGVFQPTNNAVFNYAPNAFVTEVNPAGTGLVYSTLLGGTGILYPDPSCPNCRIYGSGDFGAAIAVDDLGGAYVTGGAGSKDFPTTLGAYQTVNNESGDGDSNAFITVLNPGGSALLYSTYLGGSGHDVGNGIALDGAGGVYVAGQTSSTNFPTTTGAYQTTNGSSFIGTAFIAKFASGSVVTAIATNTALTSSANPQVQGSAVTFTATVAPASGTGIPTGNVVFSVDGTSASTVALGSNGEVTYSTSSLAIGQHTILASYGGSTAYTASSGNLTQTISEPQASNPIFSPAVGTYSSTQSVTITDNTTGASIYYTTNGTTPTTSSTKYTGAISASTTETIEAIAVATGYTNSAVVSATYTIVTTGLASTTTSITQSGSPGNYTLTATVVGAGTLSAAPTGTVSFLDTSNGDAVVATATLGGGTLGGLTWTNTQTPATEPAPQSIVVGDFNGDGIPDIAAGSNGYVSILIGNGNGTFKAANNLAVPSNNQWMAAAAFVTGIPAGILTVSNSASPTDNTQLILSDGSGGEIVGVPFSLPCGSASAVLTADFNGDGKPDFVAACQVSGNSVLAIFLGNGNGTFGAPTIIPTGDTILAIGAGNIRGNGKTDIAVVGVLSGTSSMQTITVYENDGSGNFTGGPSETFTGVSPTSMVVADFNGDGKSDLALVNSGGNNVTIMLSVGNGAFTQAASPQTGSSPSSIAVGDFNGDGIPDLAVANSGDNTVTILQGNGDGTFTAAATPPTGNAPSALAVGAFITGGKPGVAVANSGATGGSVTVLNSQPAQMATATATGVSPAGSGAHLVEASYPGDSNYAASVSGTTSLSGAGQVTVPNVVGDTQAAATTAITGAGLAVGTVTQQSSSTVASGDVISESPSAGTSVNSGSAVNLVVSTGSAQVTVPNVVGDTQAAATTAITGAGLVVGTVTTASSSTVASGNVISESPSAGTSVNSGSAVNLVVSTGPAPVTVPNVVGDTQAAATSAIIAAGLAVGTVTTASSSTVASGNVISESPSAGTSVNSGSAVNLVVSTGSAQAPGYTLSANPSSLTIQSGSSASTVITLTPTGGFTGTVNFACGTLPTLVTCTFAPASLTVTSSTPLTTTLTIGTTGTATASLGNRPAGTVLPTLFAALILLPLGFMRRVLRTRKAGSQWLGLLLLAGTCLAAAGLLGTAGCGGSSSSTRAGTYSVPITVTSGSTTVPLNLSITID